MNNNGEKLRILFPIFNFGEVLFVRKILVLLIVLVTILTFSSSVTWRMAEVHPLDYPTTQANIFFAETVRKMTNGRINIQVLYGGQLGGETETIQQTMAGIIQLNRTNAAPLSSFVDVLSVLSLPFLFRDKEHYWKVLDGPIGEQLLESMKSAGLIGLTFYDSGARSFYTTKRPIQKLEDIKGLKIRVQNAPVFVEMIKLLGGTPIVMEYGQVYGALQTGVIDGAENNIPSYESASHFEVAPHYTFDMHTMVPEILFMNLAVWNSLSKEDQLIIKTAAHAASLYERKLWEQREKISLEKIKNRVNLYYLTPEEFKRFQDAVQPLYKQYERHKNIIDAIIKTK